MPKTKVKKKQTRKVKKVKAVKRVKKVKKVKAVKKSKKKVAPSRSKVRKKATKRIVRKTGRAQAKKPSALAQVKLAAAAAGEKKAAELVLLDMRKASSFTDYFLLCTAYSKPQSQAIADEVEGTLAAKGLKPSLVEGYRQGEWVLLDYLDFVVHIFSERARRFYDLERLWSHAKPVNLPKERSLKRT